MWYEWHAESFLYGLGSDLGLTSAPSTPPIPTPNVGAPIATSSPLIDAVDIAPERRSSVVLDTLLPGRALVKIGHTSLHNAGGRSSWIGL